MEGLRKKGLIQGQDAKNKQNELMDRIKKLQWLLYYKGTYI